MRHATILVVVIMVTSLAFANFPSLESAQKSEQQRFSYTKIGSSILIEGDLGQPVGAMVEIQGFKEAHGPLANWFWVESIDGKRLDSKRGIQVNGVSKWRDGTRATLSGHETGIFKFLSLNETNYGPDDSRWNGPHQVIHLTFEVDRVVEPTGLGVERE
ncbi:MAG: hypothetical protein ACKOOI_01415 [Pirellula sp.]